jgi:hypothetical protein
MVNTRSARRLGLPVAAALWILVTTLPSESHHQQGHYGGPPPAWSGVTSPASAPAGISTPDNDAVGTDNDYVVDYAIKLSNGVNAVLTLVSYTDLTHDTTGETMDTLWSFATDGDGTATSGIVSSAASIAQGHGTFVDSTALLASGGVTITSVGNDNVVLTVTSRGRHVTDLNTTTCESPGTGVGSYTAALDLNLD